TRCATLGDSLASHAAHGSAVQLGVRGGPDVPGCGQLGVGDHLADGLHLLDRQLFSETRRTADIHQCGGHAFGVGTTATAVGPPALSYRPPRFPRASTNLALCLQPLHDRVASGAHAGNIGEPPAWRTTASL